MRIHICIWLIENWLKMELSSETACCSLLIGPEVVDEFLPNGSMAGWLGPYVGGEDASGRAGVATQGSTYSPPKASTHQSVVTARAHNSFRMNCISF